MELWFKNIMQILSQMDLDLNKFLILINLGKDGRDKHSICTKQLSEKLNLAVIEKQCI